MLTEKMKQFAIMQTKANKLKADIEREVLELGTTVKAHGVTVAYKKPRARVDNKAICLEAEIDQAIIQGFTTSKTTVSTAWAKIVKEVVKVNLPDDFKAIKDKHTTYGDPSVTFSVSNE